MNVIKNLAAKAGSKEYQNCADEYFINDKKNSDKNQDEFFVSSNWTHEDDKPKVHHLLRIVLEKWRTFS